MISTLELPQDRFKDTVLEDLTQKVFIYGKNGTGKSSITKAIIDNYSDNYDVRAFQGFDSVTENTKLNAISLGSENAEIQRQLSKIDHDIETVELAVLPPKQGEENSLSKFQEANKNLLEKKNMLDSQLSKIASQLKNKHTELTGVNYTIRNLKTDIQEIKKYKYFTILSENENSKYNQLLVQPELNIGKRQKLLNYDPSKYLEATNEIITTELTKSIILEFQSIEQQEWVRKGLEYHSEGDICSFCNNPISNDRLEQLNHYFSDKVKKFENRLDNAIERLNRVKDEINEFDLETSFFYPTFYLEINEIKANISRELANHRMFIDSLIFHLQKRKKDIFTPLSTFSYKVSEDFFNLQQRYDDLYNRNLVFHRNLSKEKEQAKVSLKLNLVFQNISEINYDSKISEQKVLTQQVETLNKVLNNQKQLLNELRKERQKLISQTLDESIAAEKINKAIRGLGDYSFQLVHIPGQQKGQYGIENLDGSRRDIDTLSTGEKNLVAFLWFLTDLENPDKLSNREQIIIFDDPMNSNDDTVQYLIITKLQLLLKNLQENQQVFILTHNIHFYLNVRHEWWKNAKTKKRTFHLMKIRGKTTIVRINNQNEDLKTSYDALWSELRWLYQQDKPEFMINPIRRILETYLKFNHISTSDLYREDLEAQKLFNVNSHSIDELEAELNGKTKDDIMIKVKSIFETNNAVAHFNNYWDNDLSQ